MGEVFAWPEGQLHVYSDTNTGNTGAPLAYVQSVEVDDQQHWARQLSPVSALMRSRVTYTLQDQPIGVSFRAQFTGLTVGLYALYKSATAVNAQLQLVQQTQGGNLYSALLRGVSGRFDACRLVGQEGGIWEANVSMQFAELSALWG